MHGVRLSSSAVKKLKSLRGTQRLYEEFDFETIGLEEELGENYKVSGSFPRICARNIDEVGDKDVIISKLTPDDVILWFFQVLCPNYFGVISHTPNPQFDPRKPEFYQYTRVQLDRNSNEIEHTRQFLCLYCQLPRFFGLKDIFTHYAYHHPLELPEFVDDIIEELAIDTEPEYAVKGVGPSRKHRRCRYSGHYKVNELRFFPRNEDKCMRLATVSEHEVSYSFLRADDYFLRFNGLERKYTSYGWFCRARPRSYQYGYEEKRDGKIERRRLLCPFCQTPTFIDAKGKYNYSVHMRREHDYQDYKELMAVYRDEEARNLPGYHPTSRLKPVKRFPKIYFGDEDD